MAIAPSAAYLAFGRSKARSTASDMVSPCGHKMS